MTSRHVTTAVTMAVLCGILVIGAVVGFNTLFAPLPGSDDEPSAAESPTDRDEWTAGPSGWGPRLLLAWLGSDDPLAGIA